MAGGGALGGTHRLQRGPIWARKRRAGARSVARSRRAILTAPEESKHTPSTARLGRCSRCPQILLETAKVARRERAAAGVQERHACEASRRARVMGKGAGLGGERAAKGSLQAPEAGGPGPTLNVRKGCPGRPL